MSTNAAAKLGKKAKVGLAKKIILLSIIPSVFMALILTIVSTVALSYTLTTNYEDEALQLTESYADSVENLVSDLADSFNVVTMYDTAVDESISLEDRKADLQQKADTTRFKDFSISYADGKTYNDTDISERAYFKYSMENKSYYVSSPVVRLTDNSLTVMMGKYFSVNGQDYLVYGGLDVDIFNNVINNVHFGDNGLCFIIDKDGQIIASSNTAMLPVLTQVTGDDVDSAYTGVSQVAEQMLTYNTDSMKAKFNGEAYLFGYSPIEGHEGWSIAVATPYAPITGNMIKSVVMFLVIMIILIAVSIPLVMKGIKDICDPIVKTADRLNSFAKGDISTPAPECNTGDETQIMTDSLSDMITTMNDYIGDINHVITSISEGDLTVKPQAEYSGEFSAIKDALNLILKSINETMEEVGRSAREVREGAEQLAEGSTSLSQNAITQASAVDEITSTVLDIAEKTEANHKNVEKALSSSQNTNEQAKDGSRCMDDLLAAIKEIEQSSREIENIINVIDDIAFQTNILALNAAIEAARAGEAGKGFAVVADEVRNLASKSSEAAQETGHLITKSIESVNRGAELAETASTALKGIVDGVEHVSGVMTEISEASENQATAIDQISAGMESVNSAIHNTTATAEQSAAASAQLSTLAVTLSGIVGRFRCAK
jgi:methyl-accepting chemotaxis protein